MHFSALLQEWVRQSQGNLPLEKFNGMWQVFYLKETLESGLA
jgi:hypothetical protein